MPNCSFTYIFMNMLSHRTQQLASSRPACRKAVVVCSSNGGHAGTAKPDLADPKVQAVRETLAKEHVHHTGGHVLFFTVEGR